MIFEKLLSDRDAHGDRYIQGRYIQVCLHVYESIRQEFPSYLKPKKSKI